MIHFRPSLKLDKNAAIILLDQHQVKNKLIPKSLKNSVSPLNLNGQFTGEQGQTFPITMNGKIILLVGVGGKAKLTLTSLRTTIRRALQSSFLSTMKTIELLPHTQETETVMAIIEGALIGGYTWRKYISSEKNKTIFQKDIYLIAPDQIEFRNTVTLCEGTNFARNLINDNADTIDSIAMEKTIRELIKGQEKTSIEVLNEKELKAKGLNLLLAVNRGSPKPPKLITVTYKGGKSTEPYTSILGKGITFDTGGLNLKPSGSIETMRTDMSGAAAVIGTLKNTLALKLKKNLLFTVAIAENAIGSHAFKPGDVYKGYAGISVEIGNTDAEGRLILADALAYISKVYKPARLIDIATLTGACVVALGHDYSALISTNDLIANQLLESSQKTDDRLWRMPLYPEIRDAIKSKIADIKNMGYPKGAAGTMTGGEFLRRFVDEKIIWAHLDIAGAAFVDGDERLYFGYGATGVGVRLLTHFLKTY